MYRWRKMNEDQRKATLEERRLKGRPMHSPKHHREKGVYLVTGTCFEHLPHIGLSPERMGGFSNELVEIAGRYGRLEAWAVLPNHYHLLLSTEVLGSLLEQLGKLHGRTAHRWNGEESTRGRKVWFNFLDRKIEGDRHHFMAVHYILHNPVKHGYVRKWMDWEWSSAGEYIGRVGRAEAQRRWCEYPVMDFGRGWDD